MEVSEWAARKAACRLDGAEVCLPAAECEDTGRKRIALGGEENIHEEIRIDVGGCADG
jgi:hypothetical protein